MGLYFKLVIETLNDILFAVIEILNIKSEKLTVDEESSVGKWCKLNKQKKGTDFVMTRVKFEMRGPRQ